MFATKSVAKQKTTADQIMGSDGQIFILNRKENYVILNRRNK